MNAHSDTNRPEDTKASAALKKPSDLDRQVVELLRKSGPMRIAELIAEIGVTATAVRQRLGRLMENGFVDRTVEPEGRGRPSHRYELTEAGRRMSGSNFIDLAMVLWAEIRSIEDAEIRRGLLQRLSKRLAALYADQITGQTATDRMHSVAQLLNDREIPFEVSQDGDDSELPVLRALACPYTELAEQDRSICSMEKMLFSELLGHGLTLSECRLDDRADGNHPTCCTFELN